MANKPVPMLLIKRLLQLKEQGSSNRQISEILHVTRNTVGAYVTRINHCGRSYKELLRLNDEDLAEAVLSVKAEPDKDSKYVDFEQRVKYFTEQLKNKKTTKQILWEEYREEVPGGYSRSQFCDLLKRYQDSRNAVMHFDHPPAELMEFDFAGDTIN